MELKELQKHILTLATLPQTGYPVISCYLSCETGQPNGLYLPEERIRSLRGSLVPKWRREFEAALNQIDTYLRQGVPEGVIGLAMFARAGQQLRSPVKTQILAFAKTSNLDYCYNPYQD